MMQPSIFLSGVAGAALLAGLVPAYAEHKMPPSPPPKFSNFGGVGLIETRSARMAPDRTLSTTISYSPAQQRYTTTFQATPWLEGTFNYGIFDLAPTGEVRFDRQFDFKLRLIEEGPRNPAIAVGFQDFLGTGLFSGEYIVASKRLGPLDLSFGVGWGRLGSRETADNPLTILSEGFKDRNREAGFGGEVNFGEFFQGESIGVFGGVIYDTPVEGLRLIAEYDSDDKSVIQNFESNIPVNFGISYAPFDGASVTASYLQGSEFNITATIGTDIAKPLRDAPKPANIAPFAIRDGRGLDSVLADAPAPPVAPPAATPMPADARALTDAIIERLDGQGVSLLRLTLGTDALQVEIENKDFRPVPQAVGRITRILSALAPEEVEEFRIIIVERGLRTAEFDLNREHLETSARARGYTASPPPLLNVYHTTDLAALQGDSVDAATYPQLSWSLGPDIRLSAFDPDNPLRYNIDAVAEGSVEVARGAFLSGAVRADLLGNFDEITRVSDSVLHHVRSDFAEYYKQTDIGIDRLAADYFFKPTDTIYAKLSAGLLEPQYAGFGGEILWRPPNSRFAYGAELYYAKQREFDTMFELRDYDTVTGHASVYLDTDFYDLDLALHVGRYLAGDWGATIEATRRFANGWEVGAFATFTDVPFNEFGEGSFDKGLLFRIPLDWGLPYESRSTANVTLRPVQRDGGQRLNPGDRLFRLTQPSAYSDVREQWNAFSQ